MEAGLLSRTLEAVRHEDRDITFKLTLTFLFWQLMLG
jgi:hypothetical protein